MNILSKLAYFNMSWISDQFSKHSWKFPRSSELYQVYFRRKKIWHDCSENFSVHENKDLPPLIDSDMLINSNTARHIFWEA